MAWSTQQRAFAVEAYFFHNFSVIGVQHVMQTRYQASSHKAIPDRESISL